MKGELEEKRLKQLGLQERERLEDPDCICEFASKGKTADFLQMHIPLSEKGNGERTSNSLSVTIFVRTL